MRAAVDFANLTKRPASEPWAPQQPATFTRTLFYRNHRDRGICKSGILTNTALAEDLLLLCHTSSHRQSKIKETECQSCVYLKGARKVWKSTSRLQFSSKAARAWDSQYSSDIKTRKDAYNGKQLGFRRSATWKK